MSLKGPIYRPVYVNFPRLYYALSTYLWQYKYSITFIKLFKVKPYLPIHQPAQNDRRHRYDQ